MSAATALLALVVLVGSAPLSPSADNAAILEAINAGDPNISRKLAPLDELLDAADLAERRLNAATDPNDATDLLTLTAAARKAAFQRTDAAEHLCRLIAAAELVAKRELSAALSASANGLRRDALAALGARRCEASPAADDAPAPSAPDAGSTAPVAATHDAPPVVTAVRPPTRATRGRVDPAVITGGALLGGATALTAALVGVRIVRGHAGDELADIRAAVDAAGGKTVAQDRRIAELEEVDQRTRRATVGLAVPAAVLGAVGLGLVLTRAWRKQTERARLTPYGGSQGAGIVLHGHF